LLLLLILQNGYYYKTYSKEETLPEEAIIMKECFLKEYKKVIMIIASVSVDND
jgi:hypothetical protein